MSKRAAAKPPGKPRKRERSQLYVALLAILLVLTLIASSLTFLFYGAQ